ncbi:glycoside hydrolase family 97 protein [Novosphingobium sp. MMS21-SN21R]|uniref:glycoside hydrolase family 97 protein n=1 Tax=Novosphingobium sp. MMS21-SN21R TaxID=2969298 RepID=UPI002886F168|nr:glycoside hydrolase family 97 protein [Novosphingobium sp. MMS21-SN21R]MDT0507459.1 glycoside hydrolase family 97 protein [Novosphingobium sp. MMS21-SN21R]
MARAQEWQEIRSPDGRLEVDFAVDQGEAIYRASFKGKPIIDRSLLGFRFKDRQSLEAGFTLGDVKRTATDTTWAQPWGERHFVRDASNGIVATVTAADGRELRIEFRVFDDGFGFRYILPGDPKDRFVISDEVTQFAFAQNYRAWWIPAYREKFSEYEYSRSALSAVPAVQTPLTLEGDGVAMAVHEAALVDYASMNLRLVADNTKTLKADLSPWSNGDLVRARGGLATPWRAILVADNAAKLADSRLILNLNEPNRLGDVSWAKPMKYIGIFWGMHIGRYTWEPGPDHGATTARARQYIDWAAANGIPGVLFEGWNKGWDAPQWWLNGHSRFTQNEAATDFDMDAVAAHARARGVEIVGHHETGAQVQDYLRQLDPALDYYERHGVKAIKLGYVGTRLDMTEWPDGQYAVENFQKVVEAAARHHIAVFPHEPVKDTGLRRTWPNLMSREGARGQEYNGGSPDTGNSPDHLAIVPFTRMLSGPFDYTPGVFNFDYKAKRPHNRVPSTLAQQLALFVVLYSPVQMAVDLPENYEGNPAFRFIHDVPTDWEESRTLMGEIGEYVVTARQGRNTEDWFLGALTNGNARKLTVPLDFLEPGKRYEAMIYADGPGADWRGAPERVSIRRKVVTARSIMTLSLAPGGGQAIRFRAL